jgi:hypothetical protein
LFIARRTVADADIARRGLHVLRSAAKELRLWATLRIGWNIRSRQHLFWQLCDQQRGADHRLYIMSTSVSDDL